MFQRVAHHLGRAVVWCALLGFGGSEARLCAQPRAEPLDDLVVVDGVVAAIAETNQVLYLGGLFTAVGPRVGGGAPVSAATGQVDPVFPKINGSVHCALADGAGGWFVGGAFTRAGSFPRTNLVHIRSDATVDAAWHPAPGGGSVSALIRLGTTLYVGGTFTHVDGQVRKHLAAVDAGSGALLPWDPAADGTVNALAAAGDVVYVGGAFTTLGGLPRPYLGALDAATGQPTTWNPGAGGAFGATDDVLTLLITDGRLFVGGYFTTLAGQARPRLGSFDLTTGALEDWNPGIGSATIVQPTVFALAAAGNTIFVGGTFSVVGDRSIINLAAVDASTGSATSWDARADPMISSGFPTALVQSLQVIDQALYVGGTLGNIGGKSRAYAAALDLVTGDATDWDPRPNMVVATFSGGGDRIYLGGVFSALGTAPRTNAAAFDLRSHQVTPWSPNPVSSGNSTFVVNALLLARDKMFVGGGFNRIGGLTRSNLAVVDLATGAAEDWSPNPNFAVYALAPWNDRLYAGGAFTNVFGRACTNLAAFDLDSGALRDWDPVISRGLVRALAVGGNTLYAGGLFRTVGGVNHRSLAAFDLETGVVQSWDPGLSGSVEGLALEGTRLFVGGRFNTVGGLGRTNYVGLDTLSGAILPAAHADNIVYGVAARSNQVFLVGNFQSVNGQQRSCVAAVNPDTGEVNDWDPGADLFAQTVQVIGGTLYTGGAFLQIGGQSCRGLAAFPVMAGGAPGIDVGSFLAPVSGPVAFQFSAPDAAEATVQVSADLADWQDLQRVPVVNSRGLLSDPVGAGQPQRFYRLRIP